MGEECTPGRRTTCGRNTVGVKYGQVVSKSKQRRLKGNAMKNRPERHLGTIS